MEKSLIVKVIEDMGYDPSTIDSEGAAASALLATPMFERSIAELKYAFMVKEDNITSDPTMDKATRDEMREYYSLCRVVTDAVVAILDQKIQLAENNSVESME